MVLDITGFVSALVTQAMEFGKKVYDILKDAKDSLSGALSWLTSTFPFNDPERTLGLSALVFVVCIGLILVFSSSDWESSGVSDVDGEIKLGVSFSGPGDSSIVSGDEEGEGGDSGVVNKTPPGRFGNCLSDEECRIEGPENLGDLKCCKPELFEGYSCAGKCLSDENLDENACLHPNACFYFGESWSEHSNIDDPNRCDKWVGWGNDEGWVSPNRFCQRKAAGSEGAWDSMVRCCGSRDGEALSLCFGYCLKSGSSYNCNDITACVEELAVVVESIEPGVFID